MDRMDRNEPNEISKPIHYPFLENNLSNAEKINGIAGHFSEILKILGVDLQDDSLQKTPMRYAKMLVNELFEGLGTKSFPEITTQANTFHYHEPLIEANITIHSMCEHHFVPIVGYCHIAYIPKDRVIGLSKLNRIAHYFARRPQVQERMTRQIQAELTRILQTADVAVVIDALHFCVRLRGIEDHNALTRTLDLGGKFLEPSMRSEFLRSIPALSDFTI